jgi:hypothetical protein
VPSSAPLLGQRQGRAKPWKSPQVGTPTAKGGIVYINPAEVVAVREVIASQVQAGSKTEIQCGVARYDVREPLAFPVSASTSSFDCGV